MMSKRPGKKELFQKTGDLDKKNFLEKEKRQCSALAQREEDSRVLHAVDGESTPGLLVPVLEVRDDGVVHVLLLLAQEVGRHRVE